MQTAWPDGSASSELAALHDECRGAAPVWLDRARRAGARVDPHALDGSVLIDRVPAVPGASTEVSVRDHSVASVVPCAPCTLLAHLGHHEPYLHGDTRSQLRFWRCSICATLWSESQRAVTPVSDDEAEILAPGWRETASITLPDALRRHHGEEFDELRLIVVFLRSAVWTLLDPRPHAEPIAAYSTVTAARAPRSELRAEPSVDLVERCGGNGFVLDPGSSHSWRPAVGTTFLAIQAFVKSTLAGGDALRVLGGE